MFKKWLYFHRLKKAKKAALKLSANSRGKQILVIQFKNKPVLFTRQKVALYQRLGIFKKMNLLELDKITLFITPKLQDNVYYKR